MVMKTRKQKGRCKISLEGELTIYQANELYEKFQKQLATCDALDINMQSVTEIDTAGVQILLALKREATKCNKSITISMHSTSVVEVFELMNIANEFGDPIVLSNRA